MDKETHLNLRQVPEDLLPALENHITEIDATKKASGTQPRWVCVADLCSEPTDIKILRLQVLYHTSKIHSYGKAIVPPFSRPPMEHFAQLRDVHILPC